MKKLNILIALLSLAFIVNYAFSENKSIMESAVYILIFVVIIVINLRKMFFNEKN